MSVPHADEVAAWTPEERATVARLLDQWVERPNMSRRTPRRRRLVLAATFGGTIALLPWIVLLSATLPDVAHGGAWRIAWVGFDIGLAAAFGLTAFTVWRRRQLAVPMLCVAATLLMCDAWFDVCLSWGTKEQTAAIVAAIAAELPLVALLATSAATMMRRSAEVTTRLRGLPVDRVSLWREPVVMVPSHRR